MVTTVQKANPYAVISPEVKEWFFNAEELPLVLEHQDGLLDLAEWVATHRETLRLKIHHFGGLLFRGFRVDNLDSFEDAVRALSGEMLPYMERTSPRSAIKNNVYTSTYHPPSEHIYLHNEQSYNLSWPCKISFWCEIPSPEGGRTPLADSRRVLARIDPEILERFRERNYIYMRNFGDGFGLTWQEVFQTEFKAEAEAYCHKNQIKFQWKDENRLRTQQVREVIKKHPFTGEETWFNHCTFYHVTTLPEHIREPLLEELSEMELPHHTLYGDGSPIEEHVMEHLRECYSAETVAFDWDKDDVLMLDNMLVCHGREPFTGPRRILAGLTELQRME
jgi:alpha-ketoglutarate-dependent taurine dioxygenase